MNILIHLAFIIVLNTLLLTHTFSCSYAHPFQRRAKTPFHNSGNNNNNGESPVLNRQDQIFHPVNYRVIRSQESVDRPLELQSGHPTRTYQHNQTPTQEETSRLIRSITDRRGGIERSSEKGKRKVKAKEGNHQPIQKKPKKRKASEIPNDLKADTSRITSPTRFAPASYRYRSSRPHRSSGRSSSSTSRREGVAVGDVVGAVMGGVRKIADTGIQASERVYRKVKGKCDAACQRAKEAARNVRRRIRGPTPPPPPSPTIPLERYYHSDSSDVGIVGNDGHLHGWAPALFDNKVKPLNVQRMENTQEYPQHPNYPPIQPNWVLREPFPSSPSSSGHSSSSSDTKSSFSTKQYRLHPAFSNQLRSTDINERLRKKEERNRKL